MAGVFRHQQLDSRDLRRGGYPVPNSISYGEMMKDKPWNVSRRVLYLKRRTAMLGNEQRGGALAAAGQS